MREYHALCLMSELAHCVTRGPFCTSQHVATRASLCLHLTRTALLSTALPSALPPRAVLKEAKDSDSMRADDLERALAPFFSAASDVLESCAPKVVPRAHIGIVRGVWDSAAREVHDFVAELSEGTAGAGAWKGRQVRGDKRTHCALANADATLRGSPILSPTPLLSWPLSGCCRFPGHRRRFLQATHLQVPRRPFWQRGCKGLRAAGQLRRVPQAPGRWQERARVLRRVLIVHHRWDECARVSVLCADWSRTDHVAVAGRHGRLPRSVRWWRG